MTYRITLECPDTDPIIEEGNVPDTAGAPIVALKQILLRLFSTSSPDTYHLHLDLTREG